MDSHDPEFRPREDDHLVEPLFAGLGTGEEPEEPEPPRKGILRRLLGWLGFRKT